MPGPDGLQSFDTPQRTEKDSEKSQDPLKTSTSSNEPQREKKHSPGMDHGRTCYLCPFQSNLVFFLQM